jgi:hypothetical protein
MESDREEATAHHGLQHPQKKKKKLSAQRPEHKTHLGEM